MILIILGCHLTDKKDEISDAVSSSDGSYVNLQGKVSDKKITESGVTLLLKECSIVRANQKTAVKKQVLVYLKKEEQTLIPEIGTEVLVDGIVKTFQEPTNPGNFNQKTYYQKQKIDCMLQKASVKNMTGRAIVWREKMWHFRRALSEKIVSEMGERYGGILCTMLFCEDSYEEDEVKEVYQKSGLGHLLAVSSLHMMFWGMGLYKILKRLHLHKYAVVVMSCIGLGVYMVFIGGSVSAIRAFLMFLIQMIGILCGREYDGLTALALTGILQLIRQPLYLFDAGFLLSYGAVLGIYLVGEPLKDQIKESLRIPLAVQISILPIVLYFYYEVCIYSFVWNLIAVPMASAAMSLGAAGMVFTPFLHLAKGILWFWEMGSNWILELPFSRWVTGQPKIWQMVGYYSGLLVVLYLINKKKINRIAFIGFFWVGILLLTFPQKFERTLEITMVDVGQGDCVFVKSPSGETYLVDGGSSSVSQVGTYKIEPFLKYKGVGMLDYVFLSHGDEDHVSGILELLERQKLGVRIGAIILPPQKVWDENLWNVSAIAKANEVAVYTMGQGDSLQVGDIRVDCLWPSKTREESGNESSMVLSMTCGAVDFLLTGDLELEAEEQMAVYLEEQQKNGRVPKAYELLKVGHHGSKNATGEKLLCLCMPKVTLISAGEDNSYGHPHEETVERIAKSGCRNFCTITCGAILVKEGKNSLTVETYK